MISASSTPTTTPSPIDAALPVICACVWIVPPPSRSWKVTSALAWPVPPGLARLHAQQRGVRRLVLLDDLDRADQLHRHRPHAHEDLGLDLLRAPASVTLPPSTAGTTRSRSSDRGVALVERLVRRELVVQLYRHAVCSCVRGCPIYARPSCSRLARTGSDPATPPSRCARSAAAPRRRPATTSTCTSRPGRARSRSARTAPRRAPSSTPTRPRCACSKGTGGMQALGDDDKANIHQTIDDEVLKRRDIAFRSTAVERAPTAACQRGGRADAGRRRRGRSRSTLAVGGDGTLARDRRPSRRPTGA